MNLMLLALGLTPEPASSQDALDFHKDVLRGPSEATVFAPGQNQDLMDALGVILLEPSSSKASQPVSASRKKLVDSLDKDDLSDSSLNVKQSKAAVRAAGNAFTTSSGTFSFFDPIYPALIQPSLLGTVNPPAPVQQVSQRLDDFGFQKVSKPKPPASKSAKGKENLKDPTEIFDEVLTKLSKLKVFQGPPSRHTLGSDGLPISSMFVFIWYIFLCVSYLSSV